MKNITIISLYFLFVACNNQTKSTSEVLKTKNNSFEKDNSINLIHNRINTNEVGIDLFRAETTPLISNTKVSINRIENNVVFSYDLISKNEVEVILLVSADNGYTYSVNTQNAIGDIGFPVNSGKNKTISWNYSSELKSLKNCNYKLLVNYPDKLILNELSTQIEEVRLTQVLSNLEGERVHGKDSEGLVNARGLILNSFKESNLQVLEQRIDLKGDHSVNIIGRLPGLKNEAKILVVTAHYDTVNDSPGADDNASGVAGILELSRVLSKFYFDNTILFVALDKEEQGFIGSRFFVENFKINETDNISGVINLDMIGYASEKDSSQTFPKGLEKAFNNSYTEISNSSFKGDFLLSFGNIKSADLCKSFVKYSNQFVPELKIVDLIVDQNGNYFPEYFRQSDHISFWDKDIKAISLGDTGGLRNPNYHTKHDKTETINFDFMVNVVKAVAVTLASEAKLKSCNVYEDDF